MDVAYNNNLLNNNRCSGVSLLSTKWQIKLRKMENGMEHPLEFLVKSQTVNKKFFYSTPIQNLIFDLGEEPHSAPIYLQSLTRSLVVAMNLFNHVIIVILTVAMAYKCWLLEFKKTAMHAHLCTLGFVCLMAEGMMVRYQANFLFYQFSPSKKTLVHSLLQFVGGSLGIGGTLQKYWGKETHFKSIHAKLGLVACILCAINFICGLWSLLFPNTHVEMRLLHGVLGLSTFIVGMLSQFYGYETGFFNRNFTNKHSYKFFTIVILALSTIGPLKLVFFKISKSFYGMNVADSMFS